jgi:hypothetical protein
VRFAEAEIEIAGDQRDDEGYASPAALAEDWDIRHQSLVRHVTFRSFGQAIGLPMEDIEKNSDE